MTTFHPHYKAVMWLVFTASVALAAPLEGECDLDARSAASIAELSSPALRGRFRWRFEIHGKRLSINLTDVEGRPVKQREVELPGSCSAAAEVAATLIVAWMSELPADWHPAPVDAPRPAPRQVRKWRPPAEVEAPVEPPAPAAPAPPPVEVEEPRLAPVVRERWMSLGLDVRGHWAGSLAPALALRFDLGKLWGGFLELEGVWPRKSPFFEGTVHWQRTSLALGARAHLKSGRFFVEPALSAAGVMMAVWGSGFAVNRR